MAVAQQASQDTLALIIKHGVMVRQIPVETTSKWGFNERIHNTLKDNQELVIENGRRFVVETKRAEHGGKWLAKIECSTSSTVKWSLTRDNLSETLAEAVNKAIS